MKKLFSTKYTDRSVTVSLFLLRFAVGGLMITHGYDKLIHFSQLSSGFADPFHIGSTLSLSLSLFAEFFCAAMLVLGLLTRFAAIPLIIDMIVALYYVHHWHFTGEGEKASLYLAGFIAIAFTGPGKFSLDRLIGK